MSANGHPLKAERAIFLTLGVPKGPKGRPQVKRALELLQRHGFHAGVTSDESVLLAAKLIEQDSDDKPTQIPEV